MADQQRWFKLWHSAVSDDELQCLSPALRWAWAVLGCHTKVHGTKGRVVITTANAVLAMQMGVSVDALISTIEVLPHVQVEEGKSSNGHFTVTWKNWVKYQEDSTQAQRQLASRSKRRGEENKKRTDEKRRDVLPPLPPSTGGFNRFWAEYPKRVGKGAARTAWSKVQAEPLTGKILEALHAQNGYLEREGGKFIPLPATWLNQRRWEDEPPTDFLHTKTKANLAGVQAWYEERQKQREDAHDSTG